MRTTTFCPFFAFRRAHGDHVLVDGGNLAAEPVPCAGFNVLAVLDQDYPRSLDRGRDGLALGQAQCFEAFLSDGRNDFEAGGRGQFVSKANVSIMLEYPPHAVAPKLRAQWDQALPEKNCHRIDSFAQSRTTDRKSVV